ncbi:acetyl-CoA carboxylase biotin carboxyl carrier protein subunit [uncultured Psychrobacter sp.]|uniref:acetyl-CoA carboxylase biotin carboxyl carrier protein n=1 Tax=uncultured Psychrobacter sp. TaxID=259303 RepID=UPI0034594A3E
MNINFNDVEKLIKIAERANIDSLEVVDGNKRIAIVCQSAINQNASLQNNSQSFKDNITHQNNASLTSHSNSISDNTAQSRLSQNDISSNDSLDSSTHTDTESHQITAPMLGTFYRRSDPSADVFVSVGDSVAAGDTLCVIEAMKIMHEVKADSAGTIKEILVDDGDVVEFDQALFMISVS